MSIEPVGYITSERIGVEISERTLRAGDIVSDIAPVQAAEAGRRKQFDEEAGLRQLALDEGLHR